MADTKRRVRLGWACFDRFKLELHDLETASFALKVSMLKSEVMETLLYGCVTWTLGVGHFAVDRRKLLLRIPGVPSPTTHRQPHVVCQGPQ